MSNPRVPRGNLLAQDRASPDNHSDTYDAPGAPRVFSEGVARAVLGPNLSYLEFYSVEDGYRGEQDQVVEVRAINLRVTLPTANLLQFIRGMVGNIAHALPAGEVDRMYSRTRELLRELATISAVAPRSPPATDPPRPKPSKPSGKRK